MEGTQQTGAAWGRFADWIMGIYAWIVTFAFGAVLIDSIYSRSLADSTSVASVIRAFNQAADFQQLPLAVAVPTGIAALIMAADKPLVRYLMIASLALTLAPLPVVMLFGDLAAAAGAGTGLRLALGGGASLLAMAATVVFLGRTRSVGGMPPLPAPS
jgi:hypothetical protein